MCGKFTAMASYAEVVAWEQACTLDSKNKSGDDRVVIYRVVSMLPMIVLDQAAGIRRVVPMRWGFPHPQNWRRPQPIHARAETIDTTRAFAGAFRDGQRGIAIVETFNEAPENGAQHVIRPAGAIGIAFVWRRFNIPGVPAPLFACVMATVAANALLSGLPTDRMPAILSPDDWAIWLGEEPASLEDVKACLKTVDDARWTMTPEERAKSARRGKPTVSDPAGLF
jgi:putative SOS response-associated peptidase YedK